MSSSTKHFIRHYVVAMFAVMLLRPAEYSRHGHAHTRVETQRVTA